MSGKKWESRIKGQTYDRAKDPTLKLYTDGGAGDFNMCQNLPRLMIKYINMQATLCPKCKELDIITRCSKSHLSSNHQIYIEDIYNVISEVQKKTNEVKPNEKEAKTDRRELPKSESIIRRAQNKTKKVKTSRKEVLKFAETLLQPNVDIMKSFLACM